MGTPTPILRSRSLMRGTAAAASLRSTVMRTISEPAAASAATCRTVSSTSAVSVLVMDCTTTGAPPPTSTPPTSTATDRRRCCGPASVILGLLWRREVPDCAAVVNAPGSRANARQSHGLSPSSVGSPRLAVRADAGELDHRRFRRKAGGARRGGQRGGDVARRRLPDGAAALADEKHHQRAGGVIVHAGDKGVAAFDAVHEAVLTQELERAVSGDRRQARPLEREPVDYLVGAQRLVASEQRGEHSAPDRRQALAALRAQRLGYGHGIARAAIVVMVGGWEDGGRPVRRRSRRFGFRHARTLPVLDIFCACCTAII